MDVIARLRYLRISPKKVRLVLDVIRGQSVEMAETQLRHLPQRSSAPLLKLLKSAEANAQHNFKLDPSSLVVKQAYADEGPKFKRYQPRAFGRAGLLRKRTSHVTIVLAPKAEKPPTPPVQTQTSKAVTPTAKRALTKKGKSFKKKA